MKRTQTSQTFDKTSIIRTFSKNYDSNHGILQFENDGLIGSDLAKYDHPSYTTKKDCQCTFAREFFIGTQRYEY